MYKFTAEGACGKLVSVCVTSIYTIEHHEQTPSSSFGLASSGSFSVSVGEGISKAVCAGR